jgi:hypothetical protein
MSIFINTGLAAFVGRLADPNAGSLVTCVFRLLISP